MKRVEESSTNGRRTVLVNVAAIFAPMCPDLPTPMTTTSPGRPPLL